MDDKDRLCIAKCNSASLFVSTNTVKLTETLSRSRESRVARKKNDKKTLSVLLKMRLFDFPLVYNQH
jgi:hypothetical protein